MLIKVANTINSENKNSFQMRFLQKSQSKTKISMCRKFKEISDGITAIKMKFKNAPKYAEMEQEHLAIHEKKSHLQNLGIKHLAIEKINSIEGMNFRPDTVKRRVGEVEESNEEVALDVA